MADPRPLITLLVPAFDEESTIAGVLVRVAALDLNTEIVVVDDGSSDATAVAVERLAGELGGERLRLLRHERNRGKGAAIRTGLSAARGEIVVIQDADLEYDPRDIPKLVGPLLEGVADVVYGTRLRGVDRREGGHRARPRRMPYLTMQYMARTPSFQPIFLPSA